MSAAPSPGVRPVAAASLAARSPLRPVPLAWRNLTANKRRLLRSSGGIGFAVLLMLMQLGFERAFFDSSLQIIRGLDGDIFLQSAHKYQFATQDPFPAAELARGASGRRGRQRPPALCRLVRSVLEEPVRRQGFPGPRLGLRPGPAGLLVSGNKRQRRQLTAPNTILDRPPRPPFSRHEPADPAV